MTEFVGIRRAEPERHPLSMRNGKLFKTLINSVVNKITVSVAISMFRNKQGFIDKISHTVKRTRIHLFQAKIHHHFAFMS